MRPIPKVLLTATLLLVPVAACKPDQVPEAGQNAPAPPVGGDPQPKIDDIVRVGLTTKQKEQIAKACHDAQEITADSECREAVARSTRFPALPGIHDSCRLTDFCLIFDGHADTVLLTDGDPPADITSDDVDPGDVRLRLTADDAVITDLVAPTARKSSATPSPSGEESDDPTTPATTTEPAETTPTRETPRTDAS